MTNMGISQFKSHAIEVLTRLAKTQDNIIITKRGKPLARIIPYPETNAVPMPGKLAHTVVFENDVLSPLGEGMWDACK